MINITGLSDSSVNFNTMLLGLNGSSSFGVCGMNVGTGIASISGYGVDIEASNFYFMARNVGMMGKMFRSSLMSPTINGTLTMNFAGMSRLTNHLTTNINLNGATVNSDYYFDQATGMMVQWRQESLQTNGSLKTNSTQIMKISSSSVWAVIPEFPTSIIGPSFIVAASVFIVLGIPRFKRGLKVSLSFEVFNVTEKKEKIKIRVMMNVLELLPMN